MPGRRPGESLSPESERRSAVLPAAPKVARLVPRTENLMTKRLLVTAVVSLGATALTFAPSTRAGGERRRGARWSGRTRPGGAGARARGPRPAAPPPPRSAGPRAGGGGAGGAGARRRAGGGAGGGGGGPARPLGHRRGKPRGAP